MAQTILAKTFFQGVLPMTPLKVQLFTDTGVVSGASAVMAFPTDKFCPAMVFAWVRWKALGTVLANVQGRFADNAALTTNPENGNVAVAFANLVAAPVNWLFQAVSQVATNNQFGLFASAPTGTFTVDARYELYQIT